MKVGNKHSSERRYVKIDRLLDTVDSLRQKGVGQQILRNAVNAPVSVMETAGEGGAWGIALLGAYLSTERKGERNTG